VRRRQGKVNRWALVGLALLALGALLVENRTLHARRTRWFELKWASAQLAQEALRTVTQFRAGRNVPIDTVNDPNRTGLIGLQFSLLTYGRSDLSDALTTTNPNFSAALVEMVTRAGVRPGDTIGVSWDGTYPALNIQLLAVAQTMRLVPVIVTAQSAGMWGANYPGLSWLEMEKVLVNAGLWKYRSRLATLGGQADGGQGLAPEGRALLEQVAESAGVECFVPASLEQGTLKRLELFQSCRALVSIGRSVADAGAPDARIPSKVLTRRSARIPAQGLIGRMLEKRIPVIHIANPSQVALDYHLPVAPVPLPELGKGRLFLERRYSPVVAGILVLLLLAALGLVVRYDIESYLGVKREGIEEEAV